MGLQPIVVEKFGGLNTVTDVGQVGLESSVSMLNTELNADRTRVFTRDGSVLFSNVSGIPQAIAPITFADGGFYMLTTGYTATTGTQLYLDRVSSVGASTIAATFSGVGAGQTPPQIVAFGAPSVGQAYVAWGGIDLIRYDSATPGPVAGRPGFIGVTPQSNRLVQAWFKAPADSPTGALGSRSTVFFSDPGLPETFSANNYVHLRPGDGEEITGVVTWRDLLFVFKESRAFVFYGESTDSTGQPVFNYRQITLSPTVDRTAVTKTRVVSSSMGVYFVATDGVYRTTGGPAVKVSQQLGDLSGLQHLSVAGRRVIVQSDVTGGHYVMDESNGEWTFWRFATPASFLAPIVEWPKTFPAGRTLMYASSTALYRTSSAVATDAGAAVVSRYRTGVSDLGSPTQKVVRETIVDGSGTVNVGLAHDWGASPSGTPVVLGASPAVAQGRSRVAVRGRNFQAQFDAAGGAWAVSRFALHVRSQKPVGTGAT